MKKKIVFLMTLILILSLSVVNVAAATGGFVKSPSLNPAPELIQATDKGGECDGSFVITPYDEREDLNDEEKKEFEDSYKDIKANPNLGNLTPDIGDLAKEKNLDETKLAVSDLFHTHVENCTHGDDVEHGPFDVVLSADTLDKYVGLLHYHNGVWSLVEGATINLDGHLAFEAAKLGSYAIVVNTDESLVPAPPTGDEFPWIAVALVAMIAITVVVFVKSGKKENA